MRIFACLVLSFSVLFASCGSTSSENDVIQSKIDKCSWIVGEWQDTVNTYQWEVWERHGDSLSGFAAFIKSGDTSIFERLTIKAVDSQLVYTALIMKNRKAVSFSATKLDDNYMVFENPAHDFPKLITYLHTSTNEADYMLASVSANFKKLDFGMVKRR